MQTKYSAGKDTEKMVGTLFVFHSKYKSFPADVKLFVSAGRKYHVDFQ
jgi:hypothetical protein